MTTSSRPDLLPGYPDEPAREECAAGFGRVEARIRGVPERDLIPINVDVPRAVATVLHALPGLRRLRSEFARLEDFDVASFDELRDHALALAHTHEMYRVAAGPPDGGTALAAAIGLRQRAFTLLASIYDEVRRAVAYLRWHENDVTDLAPSLSAGRGGRGTSEDLASAPTEPLGTPIVARPAGPLR